MADFTVLDDSAYTVLKSRIDYLIEKVRVMNNAIDNQMPSEALLELRRTLQTVEGWDEA